MRTVVSFIGFLVVFILLLFTACSPLPTSDHGWSMHFDDSVRQYLDNDERHNVIDELNLGVELLIKRIAFETKEDVQTVGESFHAAGIWKYFTLEAMPYDDVYGFCSNHVGLNCGVAHIDDCIAYRADLHEAFHIYLGNTQYKDGDGEHSHPWWKIVVPLANRDAAEILGCVPQERY